MMMTAPKVRTVFAVLAILLFSAPLALPARAELTVDITQGNIKPLPIAVPNFIASDDVSNQI